MPAIKLQKFLARLPRTSPELLPDGAAQVSQNQRTFSGDLLPYRQPEHIDDVGRTGDIKTIYALRDPITDDLVWLSWLTDVDIAVASSTEDKEQRIYYTGDGAPKITNYVNATLTSPPYPNAFFDLGLPFPTVEPATSVASFSSKTTSSYARDAGNTATIVTSTPHQLRTGLSVTISDFSTNDDAKSFNQSNVPVTVIDDTTFTYFSRGDELATTADTTGKVSLAGATSARSYVYTWYTPWLEESIASEPSDDIFLKEGQTVTVSALPTAPPAGDNFIRGIRLYRLVTSQTGSDYFRLKTMFFPASVVSVARATNVSTVKTLDPHSMVEKDRFKISGATNASFDITDGEVKEVVDEYTFTYDQVAADVAETAEATAVLFYDISESLDDPARYWGDGSYDFTDDFLVSNLDDILETDDYDQPHENMQGLVVGQNNILAGFFDNQFCLSEPGLPHAWPIKYRLTFEYDIVGIASMGGYFLVLTEKFPYQVSGNDPNTMSVQRIDVPYPCVSKRSIVNMGYGVVYATHGGLAVYAPSIGVQLLTQFVHYWETWEETLDPSTVVGTFYDNKYFASHSNGAFMYEREEGGTGYLVDITQPLKAAWLDPMTNQLFTILDNTGRVFQWDSANLPFLPMVWKSKVIVTKDYMNLGAARVVGDYSADAATAAAIAAANAAAAAFNVAIFPAVEEFATLNGGSDFVDPDYGPTQNIGALNSWTINGNGTGNANRKDNGILQNAILLLTIPNPSTGFVQFRLFVNKQKIFDHAILDSEIFRLPTGYRADTFEIEVEGGIRIRAIHIGETPLGLKEA